MPTSHRFYKTSRWKHLRANALQQSPLCADCLERNIVTPASEVHHEPPWNTRDEFVLNKLVSLCHSCHLRRRAARGFRLDIDPETGFPVDPMHPANLLDKRKA